MIKRELKRRRIQFNRTNNSNFTIRSLIDDSFSSPQMMIEINSISVSQGGISKQIKLLIQQQINIMLDQIAKIVQDHSLNLREAMNFVRSSVLFKQVDEINSNLINEIVGEYARNKIEDLEAALTQQHKECEKLRQQLSQQKEFDQEKLKVRIGRHNKSNAQTSLYSLYQRAKYGTFEEFQSEFRKSDLNRPLQLVKVSTVSSFTNRNPKKSSIKHQKLRAIFKIIEPFLQGIKERQRNQLKQAILADIQQCSNPCCKWTEGKIRQNIFKRPVPSLNINTKNQYQNDSFYTNDKMKQYYRRYYHSAFDVKKISSVLKTKTQEMQTLYKNYKSKQRTTRNFRSKSTV